MPHIKIADDAHWHAIREENIGGSEIASLFYEVEVPKDGGGTEIAVMSITDPLPPGARPLECLSPYKTGYRLWLEKAGKLKPGFVDNERVDAGHFLESGLADWSRKKWPELALRKVRRYMTHPMITGWGCTLDYETVTGLKPVEFKNVDGMIFRDQWGESDDNIDSPPLHISLQLQAQLGVSGRDEGIIIACIGGNELKRGIFKLHAPTQLKIAKAVAEFWTSVATEKQPLMYADIDTASDFYRFGAEKDYSVELDHQGFDDLCAEIIKLRSQRKRIDSIEENLAGRLSAAMGGISKGRATKARTSNHRISWPVVERPAQMYPAKWSPELTYRMGLRISEGRK